MNPILIGFLVYLFLILLVGIMTSRYIRSQSDFILGGRKLGPWVIAFSERASGESAWLLIGLPGLALAVGFVEIWTIIGCTAGIVFSWLVIARKLRTECNRFDDLTLPDFLMNRFPEATPVLRLLASLLITFFFSFYVAAQINGAGKVLDATFPEVLEGIRSFLNVGWSTPVIGMVIGAIIIVFYTIMGGFLAVAWTDLVQGIIMLFTLVVLPIAAFVELHTNPELAGRLDSIDWSAFSVTGGKTGAALWIAVIGGLSWGLGYMGQPHLLARFKAIRSAKDIRVGSLIAVFWAVPAFWGAFLIGIIGFCIYGQGHFDDPERIMPVLTMNIMPMWLAGIMISGAVAAMMSTADSQLLITSSTLSEDIVHKFMGLKVSQKRLVVISRAITLGIGILGFILAITSKELVFHMVSYAWSGLSASFGPPLLLALWWKRTNGYGILAGMICGALTVIVWSAEWFKEIYAELFLPLGTLEWASDNGGDLAALMVSHRFSGFAVSLVLVIVVSLVTGGRKTHLD